MSRSPLLLMILVLTTAVVAFGVAGDAQQPGVRNQQAENEPQPIPWGPVHEAYAQPYAADPTPSPVVPKQPPEPIEEIPPEVMPEGDNVQWIPGYFAWDDDYQTFLWISGFWRDVPPGRQWVPGYWTQAQGGWQWSSGYWNDADQADVEYLPTPPESIDAGPTIPAPNPESTYIPGCWIHQQTRWLWRPGFWVAVRPGWNYVPARYVWSRLGCVFVEGYWDRPLLHCGLLFAPVWGHWDVMIRPGWSYRPSYVVSPPLLYGALFVRADWPRYYFGNYFTPDHRRRFVPWVDYRVARNVPDPSLGYYRVRERDWESALVRSYEARLAGKAPLPPTSLKVQNEIIQNLTVNQSIRIGKESFQVKNVNAAIQQMTAIAPLSKLDRKEWELEQVPKERWEEERKTAQELRALARERGKLEAKLLAQAPVKEKGKETVRVRLPKVTRQESKAKVDVPPPPTLPKVDVKPPQKDVVPPPKKDVAPPKKVIPPPKKDVAPPKKKDVAPPKKDVIPPPKKDVVAPPKKDVKPPPKKEIPPLPPPKKKDDSPTKKDDGPPLKKGKDSDPILKGAKKPPPGPDPPPPLKKVGKPPSPKKDKDAPLVNKDKETKKPPGPDIPPKGKDKDKDDKDDKGKGKKDKGGKGKGKKGSKDELVFTAISQCFRASPSVSARGATNARDILTRWRHSKPLLRESPYLSV